MRETLELLSNARSNRRTWLAAAGGCAAATCTASLAQADESAPPQNAHLWQPQTVSVAAFKNGLGFFQREGEVTLRDGWCSAQEIPPASFGTLGIFSLAEGEIVDLVGAGPGEIVEFNGIDAPDDDETRRARLLGCLHLSIELRYRHKGTERTAYGNLVSVEDEYVVLENETNSFAVPVSGVFRLQVLNMPLRVHVSKDDGTSPEQTRLGLAYLRRGVTWIPDYSLRLLGEEEAELTLRGTLVNEAEDLLHTRVNFVVGVPHFVHADHYAPIAVGQVIRAVLQSTAPDPAMSQIMSRAQIVSNNGIQSDQFGAAPMDVQVPPDQDDLAGVVGNLPQLDGAAASDYTVYTREDLTLRQGEKAIVTLFRRNIRYGHVYRWAPPQEISHFLVLHNESGTAWTTGPCLAVSGNQPLSEDLLTYTPIGGQAELPVTQATNIATERVEAESGRKLKAHSPAEHVFYDLVTLSGVLKLKSFEDQPVRVVVDVQLPGRPLEASDDGRLASDPNRLQLTDLAGTVHWDLMLPPGETKTITYSYERYVPSH